MKTAIEYTALGAIGIALSVAICNWRGKDDEEYTEIPMAKTVKLMVYWSVPAFLYLWWREY